LKLVSSQAHTRAVVEATPCPTITDLGAVAADYPILNAITMSEVITLPII